MHGACQNGASLERSEAERAVGVDLGPLSPLRSVRTLLSPESGNAVKKPGRQPFCVFHVQTVLHGTEIRAEFGCLRRHIPFSQNNFRDQTGKIFKVRFPHPESCHFLHSHPNSARMVKRLVAGQRLVVCNDVIRLQAGRDLLCIAERRHPEDNLVCPGISFSLPPSTGIPCARKLLQSPRIGEHLRLVLAFECIHFNCAASIAN